MRLLTLASARNLRLGAACATFLALACLSSFAQDDPPDQAGRISSTAGTVSIQPAGSDDWGQAYPNLPIGPGDRIFTDQDGRVEIQLGQSYVRIGPNTDITLVNDDENGVSFGLAQGSLHVRSFGLWQGQSLDVSTPNGDARLGQAGEFRVDSMQDQGASIFTSLGSDIFVTGAGGFGQPINNWQSLELAGTNPVYPQWLQANGPDSLDTWSQQRDQQIINSASYRYVSPEVGGAAELDANGEWIPDSDYGPIWFPRNVQADWEPYHNGHWINRDPWGWVWVEDEPWGYAPFHYGRWVSYRGRWGWVPGPREQHPVWSPALVVFAGGIQVGGVGVSAWFPLGPGEAYRPWYHCSPRYIDRVNISNIRESRVVHVQTTYVNIVNVTNVTNITYVNRTIGVSAMRQSDFAAGRPARQAAVAVDTRQLDHVRVVDQPAPVTRQSFNSRPAARPVPVAATKPVFINHQGMQISARRGAQPQAPPVRPVQTVKAVPGRTVVAAPPTSRFQAPGGNQPANTAGRPVAPNGSRQTASPSQSPVNNQPAQPAGRQPVAPGAQPTGRPLPPARGQQEGNPNPPPANNQPGQPAGRQPVAPGAQPTGRPLPPARGQQEGNPNPPANNSTGQPGRQPVSPGVQPAGRPMPPPAAQQERNPNVPATRPNAPPPANNPAQGRPFPPPQAPPAVRPAPPPPASRQASPPAQPNRPDTTQKQNKNDKNDKKDQKKNDKPDRN